MNRWLLALCFFLIPLPLWAGEWTQSDVAFEAAYLSLHVLDWGQTLNIVAERHFYNEQNPVLGRHPSRDQVNTYFALTALAHVAIANWLDTPARTYFQLITIGLEAAVAGNNYRIGLRTAF